MSKIIKTFEQQAWDIQMSVNIHDDNRVTIDGVGSTLLDNRERALANIILRLNAGMEILRKDLENVKKDLENEKEKVKTLKGESNV